MDKLLNELNLTQEQDWESIAKFKSKRKSSFQDQQTQYMKYMEYKESIDPDVNEGFVTIESNHRVQLLKAMKQRSLIAVQNAANDQAKRFKQTQTTGVAVKQSKQQKRKQALQPKLQNKVKFQTTGEVKAEWKMVDEFSYTTVDKNKIEYSIQILSEPNKTPSFNADLLNIKTKRPATLPVKNNHVFMPESLLKDAVLMDLFKNEVIPEGHFGIFLQENTLGLLASISKKEFPLNVLVIKQGNKFGFISDYQNDNWFSVVKSYNENAQRPWSEKEDEIVQISIENTLIEDNMYLNSAVGGIPAESQMRYFKLTVAEKYHIYSNARVDLIDSKGSKMLVRTLFEEDKHWQELDNRLEETITTTISNNVSRVFEWIFSSFVTGAQSIALGLIARQNPKNNESHVICKVVTKKFTELTKLFNTKYEDLLAIILTVLKPIVKIKEDGNYYVHKTAYKQTMKLFQDTKTGE